jgi:hypothetical protein
MIPPWSSLILCGWRSETEEEDLASGGMAAPPGPQAKELRMKGRAAPPGPQAKEVRMKGRAAPPGPQAKEVRMKGRAAPPGPQAKELRMKGPEEVGTSNPGSHHSRSFRSVPPAVEPYLGAAAKVGRHRRGRRRSLAAYLSGR